jgi:hypothetical protein
MTGGDDQRSPIHNSLVHLARPRTANRKTNAYAFSVSFVSLVNFEAQVGSGNLCFVPLVAFCEKIPAVPSLKSQIKNPKSKML